MIGILPIISLASIDTLPDESKIKSAETRVKVAKYRLEVARIAAKEARKNDERVKKEFNKSVKDFEEAKTPQERKEALPLFSRLTDEHGKAIDNALLAEDEVRKAKLFLQEAEKELEDLREREDWAKTRIKRR